MFESLPELTERVRGLGAGRPPSAPASETFGSLSPGLSGSKGGPGGAQGIDLQAQLNALDAFLQGDDDDDDDLL